MRLEILTESAELSKSPVDLKVICEVRSNQYQLTPEFDHEITKNFISKLNIDKVRSAVVVESPYIVKFFNAILAKDYDSILDVTYPIASVLHGRYSNRSAVVEEFKNVLSIGKSYFESVDSFLEFYKNIESDSSLVLKKVKAIYDRFKNNKSKIFDNVFSIYEAYLTTLNEGKETGRSKKVKQELYSAYVKQSNQIEDVVDEITSIKNDPNEKSPYETISGSNLALIQKYFEENRGQMKKISSKLLFLAYLDGMLTSEHGVNYSTSKYPRFTKKKDRTSIESAVREIIAKKYSNTVTINPSQKGCVIIFNLISSDDFEKVTTVLPEIGDNVTLDITMLEMHKDIKEVPLYGFYYAFDSAFGTHNILEKAASLLDIESPRSVSNILINAPIPEDFDLGQFSFRVEGNNIQIDKIRASDFDKALKYINFFSSLKNFPIEEFTEYATKITKKLLKSPETNFSIDDVLRSLRSSKGETFSVLTYQILKKYLKDENYYSDIVYVLIYIAYHSAIENRDMNKLFSAIFKRVLSGSQDQVVDELIRKTKGNEENLEKIKDFLLDYKTILTPESLTRLGVNDAE